MEGQNGAPTKRKIPGPSVVFCNRPSEKKKKKPEQARNQLIRPPKWPIAAGTRCLRVEPIDKVGTRKNGYPWGGREKKVTGEPGGWNHPLPDQGQLGEGGPGAKKSKKKKQGWGRLKKRRTGKWPTGFL